MDRDQLAKKEADRHQCRPLPIHNYLAEITGKRKMGWGSGQIAAHMQRREPRSPYCKRENVERVLKQFDQ